MAMKIEGTDEDDTHFGLCKCCLRDGCFKSLWSEYFENGQLETYGEMLVECFGLTWQTPENKHLELICEECVHRARDAYLFRKQVLSCEHQLYSDLDDVTTIIVKEECDNTQAVPQDGAIFESNDVVYESNDGVYEDVEYLEIYSDDAEETKTLFAESKKTKKKNEDRVRSYKKYPEDNLRRAMEDVHGGRRSVMEAAGYYKVPRKTLASRLHAEKRRAALGIASKPSNQERQHNFTEEVKTILTYTNATPYKTKTARYYCAYCTTEGPYFEEPTDLRTHTRTKHIGERTESVEAILKPFWQNEVLKLDIENLHCTICCIVLESWNGMFKHLKEEHSLDFEEAYARVIPYVLKSELTCALCKTGFPNYHHLDAHMNAHYSSYMCAECGDTFLAENRLKKHLKIHEIGRFVCSQCGKVFTLEKYRKKHIEFVHNQEKKIKCLYCGDKFQGIYQRHLHVVERHSEKVKIIYCEMCGQSFSWRPYYLNHVRRKHNNERNYVCKYCDASFFMSSELKRHEVTHTGEKAACGVCNKRFASKWALKVHFKVHENNS